MGHFVIEEIKLVKQDQLFMNQHWLCLIPWVFCTCHMKPLKMSCSKTFSGTKVNTGPFFFPFCHHMLERNH